MRVILILITSLLSTLSAQSQDLDDFLLTKSLEKGTLYHVKEMELETDQKKSELSIDFTYVRTEAKDTVRVLMTHANRTFKGKPETLVLAFGDKEAVWTSDQIQLLYVDREKKDWMTRIEMHMDEQTFIDLVNAGRYIISWKQEGFNCEASLPKKFVEDYQIFSELLKYN